MENNNAHLLIQKKKGYQTIERLTPSQVSLIIGICISPDGSSHDQTKRLRQTTTKLVDFVRSGRIKKVTHGFTFRPRLKSPMNMPWYPQK